MAVWLIRRLDRDQKEYVLFCELQSTGVGLLMLGLSVGPSFVEVSWPCSLDGSEAQWFGSMLLGASGVSGTGMSGCMVGVWRKLSRASCPSSIRSSAFHCFINWSSYQCHVLFYFIFSKEKVFIA